MVFSIVETAISINDNFRAERDLAIQRRERSFDETKEWIISAFEGRRAQVLESKACHSQGQEEKEPAKKKPKVGTGLQAETIEFIGSLKVKDLISMLRDRRLDATGVKKILQQRLLDAIECEYRAGQSDPKHFGLAESEDIEMREVAMEVADGEKHVELSSEARGQFDRMEVETDKSDQGKTELDDQQLESTFSPKSEDRSTLKKVSSGVKSALRALSPLKYKTANNTVNTLIQKIESTVKINPPREEQTVTSSSTRDDGSDCKTEDRNIAEPLAPATLTASGAVISKLKSKHSADQEARSAKIAEMRSKSKQIISSASSNMAGPTLSIMQSIPEITMKGKDEKKNILAAQIREKAIAKHVEPEKFEQAKENSPNDAMVEQDVSTGKHGAKAANTKLELPKATESSKNAEESSKADQHSEMSTINLEGPTQKTNSTLGGKPAQILHPGVFMEVTKKVLTPLAVSGNSSISPLLSPMDTYELSDREETDSDSDGEEQGKAKKRIPEWAQKAKLMPALEHQFGQRLHDPDQIFGEVQTCDLQQIFDQKKARYQRRTSSGNWTQDRVTAAEKLAYKRTEGFGNKA